MTIALCGAVFGFERVSAAAGGSASVSFTVSPDDLALFSAAGDRMVYPVRPPAPSQPLSLFRPRKALRKAY